MKLGMFSLLVATTLVAPPSLAARWPTGPEAKQCVVKSDTDLLAGVWDGAGHRCSEYFALETVEVTDLSKAQNTADVMISLRYRVLAPPVTARAGGKPPFGMVSIAQLCTGATISRDALAPGTTLVRTGRTVSMQEWASGWKCKE